MDGPDGSLQAGPDGALLPPGPSWSAMSEQAEPVPEEGSSKANPVSSPAAISGEENRHDPQTNSAAKRIGWAGEKRVVSGEACFGDHFSRKRNLPRGSLRSLGSTSENVVTRAVVGVARGSGKSYTAPGPGRPAALKYWQSGRHRHG